MIDLVQRSVEIIRANQAASGAYVASPNFPAYRYCWFRDGAYIAYAMDRVGEHDSARRFHEWAASVINARQAVTGRAIDKAQRGQPLSAADTLHTRYRLDGQDGLEEEWPNFQLDGFGTWLWSLGEHQRLTGRLLPPAWLNAARLAAEYLSALWRLPCFDCWEEFPELVHTSTLAAIYGGLQAEAGFNSGNHAAVLSAIRAYLSQHAVLDGHFVKASGRRDVDASLISLATPYWVVQPQDERMRSTIACIERDLRQDGERQGAGARGRAPGGRAPGGRAPLSRRHLLRRRRMAAAHRLAGLVLRRGRRTRPGRRPVGLGRKPDRRPREYARAGARGAHPPAFLRDVA